MKTVQAIIDKQGGLDHLRHISIENEPYMRLVIERLSDVNFGGRATPTVSVAHYYSQNGDALRDPEMVFIVSQGKWLPTYFLNDGAGVEQFALWQENGQWLQKPALRRELESFARLWDKNIKEQGFLEALH